MSKISVNMMASKPMKTRELSGELLQRASEFHGHGGPFLVVGLRLGQRALKDLDASGWFDLRCRAHLKLSPPDSCVLDGIQVATGCTMGKMNLEASDGEGVSVEFTGERGTETIELRGDAYREIKRRLGEAGKADHLVRRLTEASDEDLFIVRFTLAKSPAAPRA